MLINEILYQNICPVSKQETRLSPRSLISSYVSRKPFCPISYKFLNLVSISSPPPTLFSFHPFYICPTFLSFLSGREMKRLQNNFQQNGKYFRYLGYDTFWRWHTLREDSNGVWDQKGAALIVRLLKYNVSASTNVTRPGPGQPRHLITIQKEIDCYRLCLL